MSERIRVNRASKTGRVAIHYEVKQANRDLLSILAKEMRVPQAFVLDTILDACHGSKKIRQRLLEAAKALETASV